MGGVLVVAETRRGELRAATLELIALASSVKDAAGGRLAVAVLASDPARYAGDVAVDGVDEILAVNSPVEHFEAHVAAEALEQLIAAERPSLVLLAHSIDSMGFGPAVAARLGTGFASDVTSVSWDGELVARRGAYADKLVAELRFTGRETTVLMVRGGTCEAAVPGADVPVRLVELELAPPRTAHGGFREAAASDVDITKADFLVSIGRGVDDESQIARFEQLAERIGATLSSSRPLVDAGWMPSARQVGQSGKTVKPKVYLALGISGAVQHLAGIRGADTIIAVNTDPAAPIFNIAHYGAVADMFEFAEELESHLG